MRYCDECGGGGEGNSEGGGAVGGVENSGGCGGGGVDSGVRSRHSVGPARRCAAPGTEGYDDAWDCGECSGGGKDGSEGGGAVSGVETSGAPAAAASRVAEQAALALCSGAQHPAPKGATDNP